MNDTEYIFNEVIDKNLTEKSEVKTVHIHYCEECMYYHYLSDEKASIHICTYKKSNHNINLDKFKLYEDCPINHKITKQTICIKRYGIIHNKPTEDSWGSHKGNISIVDFEDTHFEWDGYNPDVRYDTVAIFFYEDDDEKEKMMDLALEFYNKMNLDEEYIPKRCYG